MGKNNISVVNRVSRIAAASFTTAFTVPEMTGAIATRPGHAVRSTSAAVTTPPITSTFRPAHPGKPHTPRSRAGQHTPSGHLPDSAKWADRVGRRTNCTGPGAIATIAGNVSDHLTAAASGSYFDKSSIRQLIHDIVGMLQWFVGIDAESATDRTERRVDAMSTHERSSRKSSHSGFDNPGAPDGSSQPQLRFTIFVPTSDSFATTRSDRVSPDLAKKFGTPFGAASPERFVTATRRECSIIPPRRLRAYPLVKIGG